MTERGSMLRDRLRFRYRRRQAATLALALVLAVATVVWWPGPTGPDATEPSPSGGAVPTPVAVAVRALDPGWTIGIDDVRTVAAPPGLVPDGASVDPVGRTVSASIGPGEIVVDHRLDTGATFGLGPDERAVSIRPPLAVPAVAPDDVVEIVAVEAAGAGGATSHTVTGDARILAVDDGSVTVAVPTEVAPELLARQATGVLEIVVTPWSR